MIDSHWPKPEQPLVPYGALVSLPAPVIAFDADGTLWDTDVGEMFFEWIIQKKLVPLPPDPWKHYQTLKAQHPPTAYVWLAQIFAGLKVEQVIAWAEDMTKTWPIPAFYEQQQLVKLLQKKGGDIYVVTASVSWGLIPAVKKYFNLLPSSVIGVETLIDESGKITTNPREPVTYKTGKAQALLQKTQGRKPLLAMGNSWGDVELLELATIPVAIRSPSAQGELAESEEKLFQYAKLKGWLTWLPRKNE